MPVTLGKPPYRVPSMVEIAALPWNGHSVVSTFSGCGGSCLGMRMAGYRVLWANEFIPAAQATYRLNYSKTYLDTRDIRTVAPQDILAQIDMEPGELDVFEGSPPCASFSTAGKRSAGWGKIKAYSDTKQRTDDLFFEYARLLKGLQPKVFVAENVSGLVKGVAKGYFKEILATLKACGYRVETRLLDAQWLGVPQMRQRIIFQGVRQDLGLVPAWPKPLPYRYSVREALPWIVRQGDNGGFGKGAMREADGPSPTIGTGTQAGNGRFPPALVEATIRQGNKNGHSSQRGAIVDSAAPAPTIIAGGGSGQFEIEQETDISRYAIGAEWDKLQPGEQSERYFNMVKPNLALPCPTVTSAAGNGSTASVCHPTEKRKFSIAELKRICAFPDDFQLLGSYSQSLSEKSSWVV